MKIREKLKKSFSFSRNQPKEFIADPQIDQNPINVNWLDRDNIEGCLNDPLYGKMNPVKNNKMTRNIKIIDKQVFDIPSSGRASWATEREEGRFFFSSNHLNPLSVLCKYPLQLQRYSVLEFELTSINGIVSIGLAPKPFYPFENIIGKCVHSVAICLEPTVEITLMTFENQINTGYVFHPKQKTLVTVIVDRLPDFVSATESAPGYGSIWFLVDGEPVMNEPMHLPILRLPAVIEPPGQFIRTTQIDNSYYQMTDAALSNWGDLPLLFPGLSIQGDVVTKLNLDQYSFAQNDTDDLNMFMTDRVGISLRELVDKGRFGQSYESQIMQDFRLSNMIESDSDESISSSSSDDSDKYKTKHEHRCRFAKNLVPCGCPGFKSSADSQAICEGCGHALVWHKKMRSEDDKKGKIDDPKWLVLNGGNTTIWRKVKICGESVLYNVKTKEIIKDNSDVPGLSKDEIAEIIKKERQQDETSSSSSSRRSSRSSGCSDLSTLKRFSVKSDSRSVSSHQTPPEVVDALGNPRNTIHRIFVSSVPSQVAKICNDNMKQLSLLSKRGIVQRTNQFEDLLIFEKDNTWRSQPRDEPKITRSSKSSTRSRSSKRSHKNRNESRRENKYKVRSSEMTSNGPESAFNRTGDLPSFISRVME